MDNSSAENHCTIYAIGESPKDPNVVWVGTDDGNLQLTRDGGKTWTNVAKKLPGLLACTWISYVAPSSSDAGTCFVTADGRGVDAVLDLHGVGEGLRRALAATSAHRGRRSRRRP